MAVTLGRNIPALRVQRQLNRSSSRVSDTLDRLSSGQRINGASVDASGLAVGMQLNAEVRIANKARENVNNGISALQIADGALTSIRRLLERQVELAEQASNGSLSDAQRELLQQEYAQLEEEILRISESTEFNGVNLFSGEKSANAARQLIAENVQFDMQTIDISGDGRFALYRNTTDGTVEQLEIATGERTVIFQGSSAALVQSASGGRVVFWTDADLTGEDPSGLGQIFLWERSTGEFTQVTNSGGAEAWVGDDVYNLTISADGSTIGFAAATRYNEDGSVNFYNLGGVSVQTYDVSSERFADTETNITANITFLRLSGNGNYLGFSSFNDLLGTNGDFNEEYYSFNTSEQGSDGLRQITDTSGFHVLGGITVDNSGNAYFSSNRDLTGENSGLVGQLFKYDNASGSTTQLTEATSGFILLSSMTLDGSSVTFTSNADLAESNSNLLRQIYTLNTGTGEVEQRTNFTSEEIEAVGKTSNDGNTVLQVTAAGVLEYVDVSADSVRLNIETGTGERGVIQTVLESLEGAVKGLGALTIGTESAARGALDNARNNLEALSLAGSSIGAGLRRLSSATRLLQSQALEKENAKSRILDADIATEAADLLKEQILQEISTALLAQTESTTQIALQLLS